MDKSLLGISYNRLEQVGWLEKIWYFEDGSKLILCSFYDMNIWKSYKRCEDYFK